VSVYADMDEAVSSVGSAGETDVHGSSVQDKREAWRPVDHWTFHQLRRSDADSNQSATVALDRTWRCFAVSTQQLTIDAQQPAPFFIPSTSFCSHSPPGSPHPGHITS